MSARLTEADEIRRALSDPATLCIRLGIGRPMKRQARGVMVLCPAHNEKTPSLSVIVRGDGTISARCHGCGFSADALGLIAAVMQIDMRRDFRAVLAQGKRLAGMTPDDDAPRMPARRTVTSSGPSRGAIRAVASVLLAAGRLDASTAPQDVLAYLNSRKLLDEAVADGWAALPARSEQAAWLAMLDASLGVETLLSSALVRRDRAGALEFVWADHRLIIPWRSASGDVDTIQRRTIGDPPGEAPKYVAACSPLAPYGIDRLREVGRTAPVVLAEGAFDALALRALYRRDAIERGVVGLPGVAGWLQEWSELFRDRVAMIGFDADAAGDAAVERVAKDIHGAGATRIVRTRPKGAHDWAEVLNQ